MTYTETQIKEAIRDFVDDHRKHFGTYPMDVKVNGKVYDFAAYWEILNTHEAQSAPGE